MFVITAILKSGYPLTETHRAGHDEETSYRFRRMADARFEAIIANPDVIVATYVFNGVDGPEMNNVYHNPEVF